MKNHKKSKVRLFPLFLATCFYLAPMSSYAQTAQQAGLGQGASQAAAGLAQALGAGPGTQDAVGSLINAGAQAIMQRQQMIQAQRQKMELQQRLQIGYTEPNYTHPLLRQNGCLVPIAQSNKLGTGQMCEGRPDPQLYQQGYYDALLEIADRNQGSLIPYAEVQGHQGAVKADPFAPTTLITPKSQGLACYQTAQDQMKDLLAARVNELDKLEEQINTFHQSFEAKTRPILDEIKLMDGLLYGTKGKNLAKLKASKARFAETVNDRACLSQAVGSEYNKIGESKGLVGIEEFINKKRDTLKPRQKLSDLNRITSDIKKTINTVGKRIDNSDDINISVQSLLAGTNYATFNGSQSKAALGAVENEITNLKEEFKAIERDQNLGELRGNPFTENLMAEAMKNNVTDFGRIIENRKSQYKQACFNGLISSNFGSLGNLSSKIERIGRDSRSSKSASDSYTNTMQALIQGADASVNDYDALISRLKEESKKSNRGNDYGIRAEKSVGLLGGSGGVELKRGSFVTFGSIITLFDKNCNDQFQRMPLAGTGPSGPSMAEAIDRVKNYHKNYKRVKVAQRERIKNSLSERLLLCKEDRATGNAPGSCTDDRMDPSKAGFCVGTARLCAQNLLGCQDKVEQTVKKINQDLNKKAADYQNFMNNEYKSKIRQAFMLTAQKLEAQSELLNFGMGRGQAFGSLGEAKDLNFLVNFDPKNALKDLSHEGIQLEDPAKVLEVMKKNIKQYKKQVVAHNKSVQKNFDDELKLYKKNAQDQYKYWKKIANDCNGAIDGARKMIQGEQAKALAEQKEKAGDLNEKRGEVCKSQSGDGQALLDAADASYELSMALGDPKQASKNQKIYRALASVEGGTVQDADPNNEDMIDNFEEFCDEASGPARNSNDCKVWREQNALNQVENEQEDLDFKIGELLNKYVNIGRTDSEQEKPDKFVCFNEASSDMLDKPVVDDGNLFCKSNGYRELTLTAAVDDPKIRKYLKNKLKEDDEKDGPSDSLKERLAQRLKEHQIDHLRGMLDLPSCGGAVADGNRFDQYIKQAADAFRQPASDTGAVSDGSGDLFK